MQSSAEERLMAALAREERLRAEGEASVRELQEKLWDAEERVRRRGGGQRVEAGGWVGGRVGVALHTRALPL